MSLYIASLNSGSNGNCYYVGNEHEAVLIDVGISCREVERRMKRLGLDLKKVKAIFISHEHTDHISGVAVLAHKYNLHVYGSAPTLSNGRLQLAPQLSVTFRSGDQIIVGGLIVKSFLKHHDAVDPHSFTVTGNGIKIGVFTDIGIVCDQLIHHFCDCHAAFLEANYDEQMLDAGRYPYFLKNRIRGGKGHLSNTQALELYKQHKPAHLSHLLLAHLSKDNNDPELALQMFQEHAGNTMITVASRYNESSVYRITGDTVPSLPPAVHYTKPQLELF